MSVDKLKRLMWRLEGMAKPSNNKKYVSRPQMERAIMLECGVNPQTISRNITALLKLKWIRRLRNGYYLNDTYATDS